LGSIKTRFGVSPSGLSLSGVANDPPSAAPLPSLTLLYWADHARGGLQRINADESRPSPRRTISLSIRSRWRFRSHSGGTGEQQSSVEGPLLGRLSEAAGPAAREACSPFAPRSSSVLDPDLAPIARALGGDLGGCGLFGLGCRGIAWFIRSASAGARQLQGYAGSTALVMPRH
jgi:hypothetical protein